MIEKLDRTTKWADLAAWTVEQAIAIQRIPAPTFAERRRAEYVAEALRAFDLSEVEIDDVNNVYGLLRGRGRGGLMIAAHTDTVFPEDTDLSLRREGDLIYGAGLGDNSIGVAGMLAFVKALRNAHITPACDLWIVATSREEGLGNAGGMQAAFARLKPHISSVINVEGLAFGNVYYAGIAVRRLKISVRTPGGHSWLHFGRPSAIHSIVQLGAQITSLNLPQTPRTTYNIGLIEGGQSINSIATEASLWLDMRSEDPRTLATLEERVRAQVSALCHDDVQIAVEVVGDRPAGFIAPDHPLVERALTLLARIGVRATLETGSTDANVPLSQGCPAVTIGITRGGNAHRLDEYIEVSPVADGVRQLILLSLATADAGA